jgi:retron-type reverse transcriptase
VWIPRPGSAEQRALGIPVVRDRVVQTALRNVMEPIFERDFAAQSYGFRPGRGARDALRRVEELLKGANHWVVDADIKGYFDSIPHQSGCYNYFRYSKRNALQAMDSWIRGRLRSILRKRTKRKGKARRINDHTKWRNRFFDEAGLFNLTAARAKGR